MSRRYWNSREKRASLRWDASWEYEAARDLEAYYDEECHDADGIFAGDDECPPGDYTKEERQEEIAECPLCFEIGPVLRLGRKCWHPAACRSCLRQYLVENAQKDVKNFPLKCFHPLCNAPVRGQQIESNKLFQNEQERKRHYHLTEVAKRKRAGDKVRLVHCPSCDHPKTFQTTSATKELTFSCRACHESFDFSPDFYTLQAIDRFQADAFGGNNGYGYCPGCGVLISKGGGGNDMVCFCGRKFWWDEAQEKMTQKNFGRVPYEEIPLWW